MSSFFKKEDLREKRDFTQFKPLVRELEMDLFSARLTRAKGRIERIFRRLQDRLDWETS
jgi:hypothetical protein